MMALFFDPPEVPERIDPSEYDEVWRLIRTPQGECISLVVFDAATGVIRTKQHSESVAAFVAALCGRQMLNAPRLSQQLCELVGPGPLSPLQRGQALMLGSRASLHVCGLVSIGLASLGRLSC